MGHKKSPLVWALVENIGVEQLVNRANLAYQVLEAWDDTPGQSEEGVFDFEKLILVYDGLGRM